MEFSLRLAAGLRRRILLFTALAVWFVAIGAGYEVLLRYAQTPGPQAPAPGRWPRGAPIPQPSNRYALLLFAHPECGCTHASIEELARILAGYADRVDVTVFFDLPQEAGQEWRTASLWDEARRLPGARVLGDPEGKSARLFGARTSGQTLLFDRGGNLRFHGGITASRGHEGENDGSDAIAAILAGEEPRLTATPVFGCALFGDS